MRVWLKESTARRMSEVEAAWLAGFFDGEGSLSHYRGGKDGKYLSWRICIANTYLPSLERCQRRWCKNLLVVVFGLSDPTKNTISDIHAPTPLNSAITIF